ncbi:MAG: glycosyltransferase, partial [Blautia sp.]|nr:glycosyltransferase [Blautia sp.]
MSQQRLVVCSKRFYLNDPNTYMIYGIIPEGNEVEAALDRKGLPVRVSDRIARSAIERYNQGEAIGGRRVEILFRLPEDLKKHHVLSIYGVQKGTRTLWYRLPVRELLKKQHAPQFHIEEERIDRENQIVTVRGWAAADSHVSIRVYDEHKKRLPYEVKRSNRIDVVDMFSECPLEKRCGFSLDIRDYPGRLLYLVMRTADGRRSVYRVGVGKLEALEGKARKYREKGVDYLRGHGVKALVEKVYTKVTDRDEHAIDYNKWLSYHLPKEETLEKQRQETFAFEPKFSIVVPLYKTHPEYLKEMVDSVRNQTYKNWELCLSDGSGEASPLTGLLKELEASDERIRVVHNDRQLRISDNTNEAIRIAKGDFLAFMDHDDVLTPHALYECAALLQEHPDAEVIYSDEDKTSLYGNRYFQPHFKPDFNPDLLCSVNYISHLFVVKKSLQEQVGMLRGEFDGSQDYDFILRCVEQTKAIYHIPKILYHWRTHEESTSENPESKLYAFEAGRRAIQAHYDRIGVKAEVSQGENLGLYRTKFIRSHDPLVSILIPNMDHVDDLKRCIESIE